MIALCFLLGIKRWVCRVQNLGKMVPFSWQGLQGRCYLHLSWVLKSVSAGSHQAYGLLWPSDGVVLNFFTAQIAREKVEKWFHSQLYPSQLWALSGGSLHFCFLCFAIFKMGHSYLFCLILCFCWNSQLSGLEGIFESPNLMCGSLLWKAVSSLLLPLMSGLPPL